MSDPKSSLSIRTKETLFLLVLHVNNRIFSTIFLHTFFINFILEIRVGVGG
jgi:hypothetical protein